MKGLRMPNKKELQKRIKYLEHQMNLVFEHIETLDSRWGQTKINYGIRCSSCESDWQYRTITGRLRCVSCGRVFNENK